MRSVLQLLRLQFAAGRASFLLGLAAALVPALAGFLLLGVSGWFITASALAGVAGTLLNFFVPSALIRAFAIARTAGRYGERMLTHDATFRFLADLRARVFTGFAHRRAASAQQSRSGLKLSRLTLDIDQLDRVYLRLAVPAAALAAVLAVAALMAASLVPAALLLVLLGPLVLLGAARRVMAPVMAGEARRAEAAEEAIRLRTVDLVAGRRDLAVYGGLEQPVEAVLSADRRRAKAARRIEHVTSRAELAVMASGQAIAALALAVMAREVEGGLAGAAIAAGVILASLALAETLAGLLPGVAAFTRTRCAADRLVPLAAGADVRPAEPAAASYAGTAPAGAVLALSSVSFTYPGAIRPVLEDFSLTVGPGEWLCLAGPSGCGKSTVLALASRLMPPDSGRIWLEGQPLEALDEAALRRSVAVVTQKPVLFAGTVAENLRLAAPEATPDEMWQALERVGLQDVIAARPEGLLSPLGQGSTGLSGGEARRFTLARALLQRPCLWLLDEVTEGLDPISAARVLDTIEILRGESAVLMISHHRREMDRATRVLHFRQS